MHLSARCTISNQKQTTFIAQLTYVLLSYICFNVCLRAYSLTMLAKKYKQQPEVSTAKSRYLCTSCMLPANATFQPRTGTYQHVNLNSTRCCAALTWERMQWAHSVRLLYCILETDRAHKLLSCTMLS